MLRTSTSAGWIFLWENATSLVLYAVGLHPFRFMFIFSFPTLGRCVYDRSPSTEVKNNNK